MFQEEMAQNGQNRAILANLMVFQVKDPFEQPVKKKKKKGKKDILEGGWEAQLFSIHGKSKSLTITS